VITAAEIPVRLSPPTQAGRLHTARTSGIAAESTATTAGGWHLSINGLVVLDVDEKGTLLTVEVIARPKHFRPSKSVPEWPNDAREADVEIPRLREVEDDISPQLLASPGKQRLLVQLGKTLERAEPIKLSSTCIAYVADGVLAGFLLRFDR
jgi:hypothetical protein